MQRENKANSSSIQDNNGELLPQEGEEVVPLISEVTQNVPQKKQQTFPWGALTIFLSIFLIGYGINWVRFDLVLVTKGCGVLPEAAVGKSSVSIINRAQQAYFLEKQKFAKNIQELNLDISSKKTSYRYSIRTISHATFSYAIASPDDSSYKLRTEYFGPFWWDFKEPLQLKSYVGAVFIVPATNLDSKADKKEMISVDVVCQALKFGSIIPSAPTLVKGVPTCGADTKDLKKR